MESKERLPFVTGSQAYGYVHPDSDVDVVVLMEEDEDRQRLFDYVDRSKNVRTGVYNWRCGYSVRLHDVNFLVCETTEEYDCWREGTEQCVSEAPIQRRRAVQVFDDHRMWYGFFGKKPMSIARLHNPLVPHVPQPTPEPLSQDRRSDLLKAQGDLCQEKGWPHFAPTNGICWSCGRDTVDGRWAKELITGCQHCYRSYVD